MSYRKGRRGEHYIKEKLEEVGLNVKRKVLSRGGDLIIKLGGEELIGEVKRKGKYGIPLYFLEELNGKDILFISSSSKNTFSKWKKKRSWYVFLPFSVFLKLLRGASFPVEEEKE